MPAIFEWSGWPYCPDCYSGNEFGLKNDLIQQVQNSCQFHGLPGDDADKHLDKFLQVTQSIKVNGVIDDALHLYLFPHSLTHHATSWFDCLPRNSINTFEQMAKMFLGKYFPPSMVTKLINEITNFRQHPDESLFEAWERYKLSIDRCPNHNMFPITQIDTFYNGLTLRHRDTINTAAGGTFMKRRPEECYDLIENMTAHHNDWDTSAQQTDSSRSITSSFDTEITALKAEMAKINKNLTRVLQVNQQVKAVALNYETCGGPHSFNDCLATVGNTHNVHDVGAYQGNTITNPKEDMKGIITRSGIANQGLTILATSSSLPLVVERETKKLPEKLGDLGKFLILCDFPKMAECLALADLGASINLMPLSVWNKLSLPEVSPMCMTLELVDHSIYRLVRVAEDVFVKVGTFHFRADFVVVDFDADPQAITFNLNQTSRYSANYNDMTANQIDVIDMDCEKDSQEVLGFSDVISKVDAFLALEDDPTSSEVDQSYFNSEGDILLLEDFLNDDPSLPPPNQGNHLPRVRKELKICAAKSDKSSIDEPP
nr:reverse transcriptase domain-containing protein [Tanacetum cinerariifolium]